LLLETDAGLSEERQVVRPVDQRSCFITGGKQQTLVFIFRQSILYVLIETKFPENPSVVFQTDVAKPVFCWNPVICKCFSDAVTLEGFFSLLQGVFASVFSCRTEISVLKLWFHL